MQSRNTLTLTLLALFALAACSEVTTPDVSMPDVPAFAVGGPDNFGHTWIDSDEPGGPVFDWVDITAVGTPVYSGNADDVNLGPFSIGFDFPFYGNTFSTFRVSSNGFITFTSTLTDFSNAPLPGTGAPDNLLAVFHDDMYVDVDIPSQVYYHNDGSRLIVQFHNLRRYPQSDQVPPFYDFEAILYPNGTVVYQYNTVGTTVNSATIGIQNATQDDGITVAYNADYVHDGLAIRFAGPVDIDFKPMSCPNPVSINSRGVVPLAILGTGSFDVTHVDPASVTLAGVSPLRWDLKDVSTPIGEGKSCTDAGSDGFLDLVLHFDTQELAAALGEVTAGQVLDLWVFGSLLPDFGGDPFVGGDQVVIINRLAGFAELEALTLTDDDYEAVTFGFLFPYQGQEWDHVFVNANGNLTFGTGDNDFTQSVAEFLNDQPRIAALWDDLRPSAGGTIEVHRTINQAGQVKSMTVSFTDVPEFPAIGANSFSITLRPSGQIEIAYGELSAADGLAGVTAGGGAPDPGETDFSSVRGRLPAVGTWYEWFSGDLDLSRLVLRFSLQ